MRFLDHVDREAISQLLASDEYFWLDLDDPGDEEQGFLAETFHFHPLALEDLRKRGQRPKLRAVTTCEGAEERGQHRSETLRG